MVIVLIPGIDSAIGNFHGNTRDANSCLPAVLTRYSSIPVVRLQNKFMWVFRCVVVCE